MRSFQLATLESIKTNCSSGSSRICHICGKYLIEFSEVLLMSQSNIAI